jgi:hypothetical protein
LPSASKRTSRWERPEPGLVGVAGVGLGPRERLIAQRLFDRVAVGAAALPHFEPGAFVVVAHDAGDALGLEALEHLVGPRCIANEIAQCVALFNADGSDVVQDRLEGGQVRVDIGEERDAHAGNLDPQVT